MKRNLKLLAVSATTAITCGVIAQTVPLQNATATFSQTFFANLSVAFAIDDNPLTGWAIGTENSTKSETAVFETVEDIQLASTKELVFRLKCGAFLGAQFNNIGRFRLSATSDDRSEFADGLPTGGDVTANWEVLEPLVFTSASGAILTKLADNSLLASGVNPPDSETYTVIATSKLTRITGFRLETMEDDSLPDRGPGRSFNGNFVLYDFSVGLAGKVVSGTRRLNKFKSLTWAITPPFLNRARIPFPSDFTG